MDLIWLNVLRNSCTVPYLLDNVRAGALQLPALDQPGLLPGQAGPGGAAGEGEHGAGAAAARGAGAAGGGQCQARTSAAPAQAATQT